MSNTEINKPKTETPEDLKKQAADSDSVKKGYNEKNPVQPQGAFKPDGKKDSGEEQNTEPRDEK